MVMSLQPLSAKIWYVGSGATAWQGKPAEDVKTTIAEAIAAAGTDESEIWIAAGTYDVAAAIVLSGKKMFLYGGFAGTESSIGERAKVANGKAWEFANPTVLSYSGASGRLIEIGSAVGAPSVIDGFTMQGADNDSNTKGVYANNAGAVTVKSCIIQGFGKVGATDGGGMDIRGAGSTVTVESCLVQKNRGKNGGGIYVADNAKNLIKNCEILNNVSGITGNGTTNNPAYSASAPGANNWGGGVLLNNATIANCLVAGNSAYAGGGILVRANTSKIIGCIVVNNTAIYGGGIGFDKRATASAIINSTVAGNRATDGGGVFLSDNGQSMYNTILWNNTTGGVVENLVAKLSDGTAKTPVLKHNISNTDLSAYGTGNLIAPSDSAALFATGWTPGANSVVDAGYGSQAGETDITLPETDITGDPRVAGIAVDIGPYEVQNKKVVLTYGANITDVTVARLSVASPDTSWVAFNGKYIVTFKVAAGYSPAVKVNGVAADPVLSNGAYKVTVGSIAATAAINISASLAIDPVKVTVAATSGVAVTYPHSADSFVVDKGAPFELRFTADGLDLTKVAVNGIEISLPGADPSGVYAIQLPAVYVPSTIAIEARKKIYRVAISADPAEGGVLRYVSADSGAFGDSITVVATANPRYELTAWREGAVEKSKDSVYTLAVGGNHTLVAGFRQLSSAAKLLTLKVNGVFRQPEEADGSSYKVYLNNNMAAVVIVEATASTAATIASEDVGERALTSDSTVLTITVAAENRIDTGYYTLTVIRSGGGFTSVEAASAGTLQVYPNPTSGVVYMETAAGQKNIPVRIYSLSGTLLRQATSSSIDLSGYPQGVYVIRAGNKAAKVTKK